MRYLPLLLLFLYACGTPKPAAKAPSFAGTWAVEVAATPVGDVSGDLVLVETDEGLTGTFASDGQVYQLKDTRVRPDGFTVTFYVDQYAMDVMMDLDGAPTATELSGSTLGEYRTRAMRKE